MQTIEVQTAAKSIYWGAARLLDNNFLIAATDDGLIYLQYQAGDAEQGAVDEEAWSELTKWAENRFPAYSWMENKAALEPYVQQLEEYLQGLRKTFTLPLDLRGTDFQQAVWQALHEIPHGETVSYSQIAQKLDKTNAVRAVGTAIGANPVLIVVPCHRVLGKNGALTGYRGGLANKEKLLILEKVGL
jgi:methylated-DNA-[protein]-cysteine S-methyltransferase